MVLSQIELRHYQAVVSVADELSFSGAAYRLSTTQPSISKYVKEVEAFIGVILFVRNNQRVEITEPGRVFVEHARLVVLNAERAIFFTQSTAQGAEKIVNVGSSPYVDPYLVSTMLSVRLALFPTMRVHSHSDLSPALTHQVLSGELDMALVVPGDPNARLNFLEVADDPLYALCRTGEPVAQERSVTLRELAEHIWVLFERRVHPVLYDQILERASALGIRPRDIQHVTTAEEAAREVTQSRAVAFLTKIGGWRVSQNGLTIRPIAEPGLRVKTSIITRAEDDSRLSSEFLRAGMRKLNDRKASRPKRLLPAG